jgi:hypothetical protein
MDFTAPWGWKLKVSTAIACFVIGVPMAYQLAQGRVIGGLLAAVLLGALPFVIRGYTLTPTHLEIHRLGWTTRWPLEGLRDVGFQPGAMAWAWRVWGNGGVFAVHGWFRNSRLGPFRAFVTDTDRTVVLRFADQTVVVSPGDPDRFVQVLSVQAAKA